MSGDCSNYDRSCAKYETCEKRIKASIGFYDGDTEKGIINCPDYIKKEDTPTNNPINLNKLLDKRPKSHLETYQNEIIEYLTSKLKDYNVPKHTIMEIAQYCYSATMLVANDEVRRAYRYWEKQITKAKKRV